jgi:hypothetical protein
MTSVVKVQMPERPNDPEPDHALVFEKGRSNYALVPVTAELKRKMAGRREAFFKAERVMTWWIGDEAADPKWEQQK